jgi:hypothetical protein
MVNIVFEYSHKDLEIKCKVGLSKVETLLQNLYPSYSTMHMMMVRNSPVLVSRDFIKGKIILTIIFGVDSGSQFELRNNMLSKSRKLRRTQNNLSSGSSQILPKGSVILGILTSIHHEKKFNMVFL